MSLFMRMTWLVFAVLFLANVFSSVAVATNNPIPYLQQRLVLDSAASGGAAFILTVNGTGFVSGAVVQWNGSARTTTFVNASQLIAAITSADISSAGTALITVVNPAPGGGASNAALFAISAPTTSVAYNDPIGHGANGAAATGIWQFAIS